MKLTLVRHGESEHNVAKHLDTSIPGLGLTHRGQNQAQSWAEVEARSRVDRVHYSTMLRAEQTALFLTALTDPVTVVDERLREVEVGELGNLPPGEGAPLYHQVVARWAQGETSLLVPGGESADIVAERFDAAIGSIPIVPGSHCVVVSHAAAIRIWVALRAHGTSLAMVERALDNTGRIVLGLGGDSTWRYESWHGPALRDASPIAHESNTITAVPLRGCRT